MPRHPSTPTRRDILSASAAILAASFIPDADAQETQPTGPIIDIHQHTNYSGRTDDQLLRHQKAMGVTQTLLLPAGAPVKTPSTHDGKTNGLDAQAGGVDTCIHLATQHPDAYRFYSNQVPDVPGAKEVLTGYLKLGGIGIGEQKFAVPCDSPPIEMVAEVAQEFGVPVLMHFQHETYNLHIENFHKILEKYPKVNFIGHAQTFWAYMDKNCDPKTLYPKGKVAPGGLTDRYLSDYPNMFADTSAGSGLNFFNRDEDNARDFLTRHQNKLLFGSDCNDTIGRGPTCLGWLIIHTLQRLSPTPQIPQKILHDNAKALFKL
ncbi:MAG TPA: amidohydrolase family protein [Tepidisphaeraceae bacterium]